MSIIGLVQKGGHKEIMAIGTYAQEDDTRAEVAFVVREDKVATELAKLVANI